MRWLILGFLFFFPCVDLSAQEQQVAGDDLTTTKPVSRMQEAWWKNRHDLRQKEKANIDELDVLLVGDSITQGWEGAGAKPWKNTFGDLQAFNLGFSGDRTEHVIWRLQNGEVEGLNPRVVMVLIGTNNTGHKLDKPENIARGVAGILTELKNRLPDSKVILLSLFPYDKDPNSPRRKNNDAVNEIIKNYDDGKQVYYLDICDAFFDDQGNMSKEITPDFLHLSEKGYQIWADQVNDKIRTLRNE